MTKEQIHEKYPIFHWWQHPELWFSPTYEKEEDGVKIHYKIDNGNTIYVIDIIYDK